MCTKKLKKHFNEKIKILFMLLPFLLLVSGVLFLGIVEMIEQSLEYIPYLSMDEISLKYYKEVLTDKNFYSALKLTFYLGTVPTIFSVFFGTLFAIQVYFKEKKSKINLILQAPIIIPYSVYAFFVIILFMQTGLIARIFHCFNIIENPNDFPLLIYDDNGIGILIVYFLKQVPFVYFIVSSALLKVDPKIIQASYNLGANRFQTVIQVILPMIKSSIFTSLLLCFAFNFGSFEVPYILANPKNDTLPLLAYKKYISTNIEARSYSMVINTLLLVICCVLLGCYLLYSNKTKKKERELKHNKSHLLFFNKH